MKTFNLLLGLLLGLIIGLLSTFGAIGWGLLYFMTESKKDAKPSGVDRTTRKYKARVDAFDHEYDTRADAESMLDSLRDKIDSNKIATVENLKTGLGYPIAFSDRSWGWKNLSQAQIMRNYHNDRFKIIFPDPVTIREYK